VALAKALGASVVLVTVVTPLHSLGGAADMFADQPEPVRKAALDYLFSEARAALADAQTIAAASGVPARVRQLEHEHPYAAILATAEEEEADLIVLATHGLSGIAKLVLGSVAQKVLTHASRPVLVCR
jgi:nucleotide-binding universal stress UspA family protein